jgi:hypothetical protein
MVNEILLLYVNVKSTKNCHFFKKKITYCHKNIFILIDKILEGLTEGQFSKLIDHVIDNITDSHIQTLFNNTDFCEKLLESSLVKTI